MAVTINGTTGIAGVDGSASTPAVQGTDTNTGIFFGTDTVTIATGGTAAVTVDSGQRTKFPTTIGVGGATPSTSGSGISFPATQSASSDANTLDDYEEGTWTPTLAFGGGSTGITYTARRVGFYTKIGRLVTINFFLSPSNIGSSTGTATITGLPFQAANNNQAAVGGCMLNVISNSGNTVAIIDTNSSIVDFYTTTTAGTRSQLSNTNFSNNCEVAATISYLV